MFRFLLHGAIRCRDTQRLAPLMHLDRAIHQVDVAALDLDSIAGIQHTGHRCRDDLILCILVLITALIDIATALDGEVRACLDIAQDKAASLTAGQIDAALICGSIDYCAIIQQADPIIRQAKVPPQRMQIDGLAIDIAHRLAVFGRHLDSGICQEIDVPSSNAQERQGICRLTIQCRLMDVDIIPGIRLQIALDIDIDIMVSTADIAIAAHDDQILACDSSFVHDDSAVTHQLDILRGIDLPADVQLAALHASKIYLAVSGRA